MKNYLKWNINRESAPEKKRSLISWTKDIKNDILHYVCQLVSFVAGTYLMIASLITISIDTGILAQSAYGCLKDFLYFYSKNQLLHLST